jgi:hypothetical protein
MELPKNHPKKPTNSESEQSVSEFQHFFVAPNFGRPLSWDEAEKRVSLFGKNVISLQKKRSW